MHSLTEKRKNNSSADFIKFQKALNAGAINDIDKIKSLEDLLALLEIVRDRKFDLDDAENAEFLKQLEVLEAQICQKINSFSNFQRPIQYLPDNHKASCSSSALFFVRRLMKSPYTYASASLLLLGGFFVSHYTVDGANPFRDELFKAKGIGGQPVTGEAILVSLAIVLAVIALIVLCVNKKNHTISKVNADPSLTNASAPESDITKGYEFINSSSQYF